MQKSSFDNTIDRKHANMTEWLHSDEKKALRKDIVDGVVTAYMRPSMVYDMREGIYHRFDYTNFPTNLRNLKISIAKLRDASAEDTEAFVNTVQNNADREIGKAHV